MVNLAFQIYMDQNHNINSPGQSRHLYHTMSDFLLNECWDLNTPVKINPENAATGLTPTLALATLSLLISWLIYA